MLRSMDLGTLLNDKLDVKYTTGSEERERRKVKRKEKFCGQVRKAVCRMMVSNKKLCLIQYHAISGQAHPSVCARQAL